MRQSASPQKLLQFIFSRTIIVVIEIRWSDWRFRSLGCLFSCERGGG
jgi:hypothetical protein